MLRLGTLILALLLNAGGWFTQPASAIATGRDSSSIVWNAKDKKDKKDKSDRASIRKLSAPFGGKIVHGNQASALLPCATGIASQPPQAVADRIPFYQSRVGEPPFVFRSAPRPPPQNS